MIFPWWTFQLAKNTVGGNRFNGFVNCSLNISENRMKTTTKFPPIPSNLKRI